MTGPEHYTAAEAALEAGDAATAQAHATLAQAAAVVAMSNTPSDRPLVRQWYAVIEQGQSAVG